MAATALSDLYYLLRTHCPGAGDEFIGPALARAARLFANDTRCLRESVSVDTTAGEQYSPVAPTFGQEEIKAIKAATYNGEPMDPVSPEEVDTSSGDPSAFWWDPANGMGLWPKPDATVTAPILANIIRIPKRDCTDVSSELLDNNGESAIKAASLSELLVMKANWQDLKRAAYWLSEYRHLMVQRRSEADRQYRQWAFRTRVGW